MLTKLFKRKTEQTTQAPQDIEGLRPHAGEVRQTGFEETLYLAPLPIYTGQQPVSIHDFSEVNSAFLQLGGSNLGMVWQAKMLAWVIWIAIIILVGMPLAIAILSSVFRIEGSNHTFFSDLSLLLQVAWTCFLPGPCLMVGICVHSTISQTREQARQYPLRFNRQRREVCFISSDTHEILSSRGKK